MTSKESLKKIANVLRRDSIESTSEAGSGHPTSCLSCAEIMSCLFFGHMKYDVDNAENPENDEFVLSKGHAAPIYYSALKRAGCIEGDLKTLRKLDSPFEGHPIAGDFDWVKVSTGSLGQGLSVGLGYSFAAKFNKRNYKTYVLLGDSESTEGSNYEALQLAGYHALNNIVAIFDVNRLGQSTSTMFEHNMKNYENIVSSFGWEVQSIDGNNIEEVLEALDRAEKSDKPYAILAKTYKGKGVSFLEDEEGRHGKALKDEEKEKALEEIGYVEMPEFEIKKPEDTRVSNGEVGEVKLNEYEKGSQVKTRDAYGNALKSIAGANPFSVAVDGEVSDSTSSEKFREVALNRQIECYIAEQNMFGIALGLSKKGLVPFASSFAAFHTRAHDQIRMAAHSSANFVSCGSHAGVSIGEDGASQMGLEDIGLYRALSNSSVFYPADAVSAEKLTLEAMKQDNLSYIRTTRPKMPVFYDNSEEFKPGEFKVLKESSTDKVVIAGAGITLHEALEAQEKLKSKGVNAAVVDIYSIKPFDGEKFVKFVKEHGNRLVVAEDHFKAGGIGEMLASSIPGHNIGFKHLHVSGLPHSGSEKELLKEHGIDSSTIEREAKKLVG